MLFETGNSVEQLKVCACVCLSIVIMTQTKLICGILGNTMPSSVKRISLYKL